MASFDNRQLRAAATSFTLVAIAAPFMCFAQPGLYSLEQAPAIGQRITDMEAMGDAEAAWELEQELLALATQHPDDLRTVPIFRDAADKRADVLRRFLSGEVPPQIQLGCYYDFTERAECETGSKGRAVRALGLDAQRNYADAIAVILRNELYSSDELRGLESAIVRSAYSVRPYDESPNGRWVLPSVPADGGDTDSLLSSFPIGLVQTYEVEPGRWSTQAPLGGSYVTGRMSLERSVAYEYTVTQGDQGTSGSLESLAEALVQVADWDLLYSFEQLALEEYELAYEMLRATGTAQSSIDELLAPEAPIVLPTFRPNALSVSQDAEQPARHYVDVTFEITRDGKSRRIEVLDTANASREAERELIRLIKQTTFRPRLADGQFADKSEVTVRYDSNE